MSEYKKIYRDTVMIWLDTQSNLEIFLETLNKTFFYTTKFNCIWNFLSSYWENRLYASIIFNQHTSNADVLQL